MKPTKLLTIILLLCCPIFMHAHIGGHYTQNSSFKTWQLSNGNLIKGNFSFIKNTNIYLEQENGKLLSVPLNQLSVNDQKIIQQKKIQIIELNQNHIIEPKSIETSFVAFGLIVLFIGFYFVATRFSKPIYLMLPGLVFCFLAFKTNCFNAISKTDISVLEQAFAPYKDQVKTSYDNDYFYIESNGLPTHGMMVGITNWQQQIPVPQNYTQNNHWSIPLHPILATTILSTKNNFMRGAIAIAVNGVPIFNPLNNRGEDAYLIGELDQWGGHCGKADDYHYHIAPLCLEASSGLKPIAFALDGFAIYGQKEPDGTQMKPLDDFHGHQDLNSSYHYHGTKDYPYTIGAMRGVVKTDNKNDTENQIMPQAFSAPFRPPLRPLRGATITGFKTIGANSNQLIYEQNGQNGIINYHWDNKNKITIEQIPPSGETNTNTYVQKFKQPKR